MNRKRLLRLVPASLFLLLSLSSIHPLRAQDFGLGDQVLVIGPGGFSPASSGGTWSLNANDGYLYGNATFKAGLNLPDGAKITQVCAYGYVPAESEAVSVQVLWFKQVPGGQSAGNGQVSAGLVNEDDIGYGVVCTGASFVVHDHADIDGDGTPDNLVYEVLATTTTNAGFGGLRITWNRQVSPPPAAGTFNDVPVSDSGFQYIEALAASGITAGCGGGKFCPDANLTRRQMAVFLAKALGLHWPD